MRLPATQIALRVIQDEHDLLQSVIHGMLHLVRDIAKGGAAPDLKVFRAMLFYIREYPEKVHHPKEDHYLFARLRARTNQLDATIAELEVQHAKGDALIGALEHALAGYELVGAPAFKTFSDMVENYAAFYTSHMRLEEDEILPVAAQVLTPDDWKIINDAFSANINPLAGAEHKQELQKLFSLIVNIAPPPIGVGPIR
jgi:hemerythrin-like domain-containing protein